MATRARPQAVLFACGMNAVRSPMAAGLFKHFFGRTYVGSAGVRKDELDPFAVAAMEELGLDISKHRPMTFEELVAAVLVDGSYHDVDSNEMAFKGAASMGFKDGCRKAKPVLLEPVMDVEVVTPEEYMGAIVGDLNSRRGRIISMEARGTSQVIRANVPLATMFGYATEMRSMTQGRATYTMQFARYEETPTSIAEEIMAKVAGKPAARAGTR